MKRFHVIKVQEPGPRMTVWSGTAVSARRSYEWFFWPDENRARARSERPSGSGMWINLERVPSDFKAEIARVVAAWQKGGAL